MSSFRRLLGSLHRVFDKRPVKQLALRVSHPDHDVAWSVESGVLTLASADGPSLEVDLSQFTLAALADHLAANGYAVPYRDGTALALRSAGVLLDGTGHSAASNGDHLYAYTNPLWAYLRAVSGALDEAREQVAAMLRQMKLRESEGEWADLWGLHYGVPRRANEPDAVYTARIVSEVLRPRNNALALENTLTEALGSPVQVREPWKEMFVLGRSALSSADRLQDGRFYIYHTIELIGEPSRESMMPLVAENKPAGTLAWYRQRVPLPVTASSDVIAHYGWTTTWDLGKLASPLVAATAERATRIDHLLLAGPVAYTVNGTLVQDLFTIDGVHYNGYSLDYQAPEPLYRIVGEGTGEQSAALTSASPWPVGSLGAVGYTSVSQQVDLNEVPYGGVSGVTLEVTQSS